MDQMLQQILDIESIKSLKAKYCRTMHQKDWKALEGFFTEDLVVDFRNAPGVKTESRDSYLAHISEALREAVLILHNKMPEITLLTDTTATGIWAIDDFVKIPGIVYEAWGHSHENYRKEGGAWKISKISLSRLRVVINGSEQDINYEIINV